MLRTGEAFLAAYLKGEESRLLSTEHLDRVFRTNKLPDTLAAIADTDIGDYFDSIPGGNLQSFEDIDRYLWLYLSKCINNIYWFKLIPAKARKSAQVFSLRYDVSNIKVALRSIITGKKSQMIPIGFLNDTGLLPEFSMSHDIEQIIGILKKARLGEYAHLLQADQDLLKDASSLILLETKIDKQYYQDMLQLTENKNLIQVYKITIDLTNLQIVLRSIVNGTNEKSAVFLIDNGYQLSLNTLKGLLNSKLSDVPNGLDGLYKTTAEDIISSYEKEKSIAVIDEIIEKQKYSVLKEALSTQLSASLLIPLYISLKELEMRNLRLILKAIVDNVSLDRIKGFLVMPS